MCCEVLDVAQIEKCYLGEQWEWGWEENAARNTQCILLGIILSKRYGGNFKQSRT